MSVGMAARLSLLLPFLICVLGVTAQAAETRLRIGGTGAALGVMSRLAAAFAEQEPGVAVEVLPSLGSSGGIRALGEGAIDIGPDWLKAYSSAIFILPHSEAELSFSVFTPRTL